MNSTTPTITTGLPAACASGTCALFGHKVHHTVIARGARTPCVRCGVAILDRGTGISRIAHTLSCFFGKHHYGSIATRDNHHEYVCEQCGHSLLFELARDPYASLGKFGKRVNYACGLFGHRVHVVATRAKAVEYACRCGHPFVKAQKALTVIRHPLACVLMGHFVTLNETRGDWAEYLCNRCGHPFYFRLDASGLEESQEPQSIL
jgi:DNA-directed RNA polymerase subunit RPC12/RpoP